MSLQLHFSLQRKGFALNVRLNLPDQGVIAIFGRSGSGKTTLLRCIAGLEHQPGSSLIVKGKTWQEDRFFLPVHRRPLGYVFQEASLFPHLRILQNLQYGQKRSPARPLVTLDEVVDLFDLSSLLARYPDQLSGGQRQRVALARALLTSPELLLMDEPLTALDLASKDEILSFIEKLRDQFQLPILYVSHSIEEVTRLADHLVTLEQGQVMAEGPLQPLLTDPALPFIRTETASTVLLGQTRQADAGDGLSQIDIEGQPLLISHRANLQDNQPTRIRILARDVVLATRRPTDVSLLNCLDVQVLDLQDDPLPSQQLVRLQLGQQTLLSRISRRSARQLQLAPGQVIHALIKGAALN